jgi:peptidoglycan/LPS O-acetylase OafA/YrhL
VLSGFLLTLPFARAALEGSPPQARLLYFKRRFMRVFPAYYAQLFLILAIGSWFVTWRPLSGVDLIAHLVMFFNIGAEPVRPVVGLWWTLPVELGFYILLPFIAPLLRLKRWLLFLSLAIPLSFAYRYWAAAQFAEISPHISFLVASQLPGSLAEFLLGSTAALLVQLFSMKGVRRPSAVMLDAMFLAGVIGFVLWLSQIVNSAGDGYWRGHWSMVVAPFALGLPLSLAVVGLYWGSRVGRILFANPVIYFLGLVSYSLYLWHFVVMQQIQLVFGESYLALPGFTRFLASVVLVIVVSSASYYLFERPFFRLKSYRQSRNSKPGE